MSKDPTQKLPDGPSFEERVFARFDAIDSRLQRMEERQERIESRLDALESRQERVEARLEALESQAEQRAFETKPIWERALAEILEVKEKVADLDRKFDILTEDIMQVRADQRRLDRRLDALAPKPTH